MGIFIGGENLRREWANAWADMLAGSQQIPSDRRCWELARGIAHNCTTEHILHTQQFPYTCIIYHMIIVHLDTWTDISITSLCVFAATSHTFKNQKTSWGKGHLILPPCKSIVQQRKGEEEMTGIGKWLLLSRHFQCDVYRPESGSQMLRSIAQYSRAA